MDSQRLATFDPDVITYPTWTDFLEQFFVLHEITADLMKKAVIISHLTIPVYETICVLHPTAPADAAVTSAMLLDSIKSNYHHEKSKNVARHRRNTIDNQQNTWEAIRKKETV